MVVFIDELPWLDTPRAGFLSAFEHFSENGQGDVLVSGDKDGNDNIHLPSAIRALSAGVEEVMKMRSYGTMDWGSRRRSAEHGN